jgi:hypothetical protein
MTTARVLVERLEQAAHAVRLARYELPANPDWQPWRESLWQIEHLLAGAAEDIHAEDLRHPTNTLQWVGVAATVQVRR